LRAQVPHQRLVAERVVRLSRAQNHTCHLVEKAPDDGPAVVFSLKCSEVNGELAAQLERVTRLAARRPRRFEDSDSPLPAQSFVRSHRGRAAGDGAEARNDLPSCIAPHLCSPPRIPPGQLHTSHTSSAKRWLLPFGNGDTTTA
jgi:hypothetical protein